MTSWYGPLIDLSKASHHVGNFVQLLGFVHRSTPVQYKLSRGEIIKTDFQVGDDTRPLIGYSPETGKCRNQINLVCPSLSEVLRLTSHCKAIFGASVGEIFLPITWRPIDESENENMFISKRLYTSGGNNLAEDLICTGYRLCGSPLDPEHGFIVGKNSRPLYCEKSSDRLHAVRLIYRPFMLHLWDESEHMPLLVKNNAAEKLFGSIKAERVYLCYRDYKRDKNPDPGCFGRRGHPCTRTSNSPKAAGTMMWKIAHWIHIRGKKVGKTNDVIRT